MFIGKMLLLGILLFSSFNPETRVIFLCTGFLYIKKIRLIGKRGKEAKKARRNNMF